MYNVNYIYFSFFLFNKTYSSITFYVSFFSLTRSLFFSRYIYKVQYTFFSSSLVFVFSLNTSVCDLLLHICGFFLPTLLYKIFTWSYFIFFSFYTLSTQFIPFLLNFYAAQVYIALSYQCALSFLRNIKGVTQCLEWNLKNDKKMHTWT